MNNVESLGYWKSLLFNPMSISYRDAQEGMLMIHEPVL